MRWSALRGRALDEAAAALLEYFDASVQSAPGAAHGQSEREAAEQTSGTVWRDFDAALPLQYVPDTAETAAELRREMLRMSESMTDAVPVRTAEDAAPEAAGFSAAIHRRDALRGVPEMDDISEFFRRDSRRYDKGFSGGNGL